MILCTMSMSGYIAVGSDSEERWAFTYIGLAWAAELGNGVIQTIVGPMQPYLAYNLNTDTSTINLIWTLGFIGFLIGSLLISHVFTKYINSSKWKLTFMAFLLLLTGFSTIIMPFMDNLPFLLACRFVQFLGYGTFLTADSVLIVYTLGPHKSRPFINALHFFISVGFLLGTFLVQPFLPDTSSAGQREVCSGKHSSTEGRNVTDDTEAVPLIPEMAGMQSIAWPFVISGVWISFVSVGFFLLAHSGLTMPRYYDENTNTRHKEVAGAKLSAIRKKVFLAFVIMYFALSGGIIRLFQSMATTFALCGPLELNSHRAALTDSFYSFGMSAGRLASVYMAMQWSPPIMTAACMAACSLAMWVLVGLAPLYHIGLYVGVAIMGFFVSWQFGSGFSWTSSHMNITGRVSSIFFIGLGVGSLSSPPLAGWLFQLEPMYVMYLACAMVIIQCTTVLVMWVSTKGLACSQEGMEKLKKDNEKMEKLNKQTETDNIDI